VSAIGRPVGRPGIVTPAPVAMPKQELMARVFRTLGDHTRLRILEYLRDVGAATQRELVEHTGAPQPRVSQHLGCLTWCGLVVEEPEGRSIRYRLHEDFAAGGCAWAWPAGRRRPSMTGCASGSSSRCVSPAQRPAA
jgi:DNA-binding transcriptional ArsR family regulator